MYTIYLGCKYFVRHTAPVDILIQRQESVHSKRLSLLQLYFVSLACGLFSGSTFTVSGCCLSPADHRECNASSSRHSHDAAADSLRRFRLPAHMCFLSLTSFWISSLPVQKGFQNTGAEHAQPKWHAACFYRGTFVWSVVASPPPHFSALNGVEFQDPSTEILQTYLSQSQPAASECYAVTHIFNYIQQPYSLVCMKIHPDGCDTSGFLLVRILILRPDSV